MWNILIITKDFVIYSLDEWTFKHFSSIVSGFKILYYYKVIQRKQGVYFIAEKMFKSVIL